MSKLDRPVWRASDSVAVDIAREALERAGIDHRLALISGDDPGVVFFVAARDLQAASVAIERAQHRPDAPFEPEEDGPEPTGPARFPRREVTTVALVVVFHLALALWLLSGSPQARELLIRGALRPDLVPEEPWRLVTSLFLHSGPRHVLANGLSLMAFGVPLLQRLQTSRTAVIYLLSGIGGALAATWLAPPAIWIVGSSGAVSGIFGAWVVLELRVAAFARSGWRAGVRTLGIAMLMLPTLLTPTSASGQAISVESHLGGLVAGMLTGALISIPLLGVAVDHPAEDRRFTAPNRD